ncbi:matrixin family metalloprotease [Candidatus Pacearchaeota archaeon]|nr:matrixin family metalloprotease [Candidatus Pacearchaeota archaeon]
MKWEIIVLSILVVALVITSIFLYKVIFPGKAELFNISSNNDSENIRGIVENNLLNISGEESYPGGMLFYENMRFSSKNISYSLASDCDDEKNNDARLAFEIISNKTILNFNEISKDGQISVACNRESVVTSEFADYFIAGEGGPSVIINTSEYRVILNGTILLYRDNECNYPVIAVHEIFHVLGFRHSLNEKSIMYNFSRCDQEIGGEITGKVNELYKDPSLPDLFFRDINATKIDRYLTFEAQILNGGLSSSKNISFSIYANSERVATYELGSLDIGAGKIIKVDNLIIPGNTKNLTFIIDEGNLISEIDKKNNKKELTLS